MARDPRDLVVSTLLRLTTRTIVSTPSSSVTSRPRLRPQLEAAQQAVPAVPLLLSALEGFVGRPDVTARWEALDISVQRQIVDLLLSITIDRTRRGPGFDES